MSSVGRGSCSPVHVDVEVWPTGIETSLATYANESYVAGDVGYIGRSGLYTTSSFVDQGQNSSLHADPFDANFWKDYKFNEELIHALRTSLFFDDPSFNATSAACAEGEYGCHNGCAKSYACTLREQQLGKECLMVVMGWPDSDPGYVPAVLSNLGIAAYFCYLGGGPNGRYVLKAASINQPVLFYSYEPQTVFITHPTTFQRVFLPDPKPDRVALATGTFGENGYGEPSVANQVDVDFSVINLLKYGAKVLQQTESNMRVGSLLGQLQLTPTQLQELLQTYNQLTDTIEDLSLPEFEATCTWLKKNYAVWSAWLEPLPLCDLETHVTFQCDTVLQTSTTTNQDGNSFASDSLAGSTKDSATTTMQQIVFAWRQPDPDDPTRPYDCDGGLNQLPDPLHTSRMCEWVTTSENYAIWRRWITQAPECSHQYYQGQVSSHCQNAKRVIRYSWILPDPHNASESLECTIGADLPPDETIPCDFVPVSSTSYSLISTLCFAAIVVLLVVLVMVVRNASHPVFAKCHTRILCLQSLGSMTLCFSILFQAGQPSDTLCMVRPLLLAVTSTPVVGVLLARSWTTYRLILIKNSHRTRMLPLVCRQAMMLLVGLWCSDVVILGVWFATDRPLAQLVPSTTGMYDPRFLDIARIRDRQCTGKSEDSAYAAALILVRALVLLATLGLSLLNRSCTKLDGGESFWLTTASCTGLTMGLLLLAIHFLRKAMHLDVWFAFFHGLLLAAVLAINLLLLLSKHAALETNVHPPIHHVRGVGISTIAKHKRPQVGNGVARVQVAPFLGTSAYS